MSRVTRINPEGFTSRPSEMAWGCVSPAGWVPYPPKIPRRHALLDTAGRIDDPCDRPLYEAPDWRPMPAFKPPREGYPNDMCNPEDYPSSKDLNAYEVPEGSAVINVGKDTAQGVQIKIPVIMNALTSEEEPTLPECCEENRGLEEVRKKYDEVVGHLEEREAGHPGEFGVVKCMGPCNPLQRKYPCRGVIDELPDQSPPVFPKGCGKTMPTDSSEEWKNQQPVNGWEFIDKCKTCDYYPIQSTLPRRFNNPGWFKGYGCERPVHPFYVTTSEDYGRFGPNPHTMTQMYYPKETAFTELLGVTGMYRNRSLNTSSNKLLCTCRT